MSDKPKGTQSIIDSYDDDVAVLRELCAIIGGNSICDLTCRSDRIVAAMAKHNDRQSFGTLRLENVEVKAIFTANSNNLATLCLLALPARRGKFRAIPDAKPIGRVLGWFPTQIAGGGSRKRQPLERLDRTLEYAKHITVLGVHDWSISKGLGAN